MRRMSALIVLLISWTVVPKVPPSPEGTLVVIDGSASSAERARVDDAVALFEAADLQLPATSVRFGSGADCKGHLGLFSADESPLVVSICSDLAFVLPHELAHVWIHQNLDDAATAAYIEARGLPTWESHSFEWGDRGVEDAAFVMQQVLMFGRDRSSGSRWQERVAVYELLTQELS